MTPMHDVASIESRRIVLVRPFFSSAGRFCIMVDKGVEESREKASWLTTWFTTAGLISMGSARSSGVGVRSLGGEERGESNSTGSFLGDAGHSKDCFLGEQGFEGM